MRKSCKGCTHCRPLTSDKKRYSGYICHYIIDTGLQRKSPAENCKNYTTDSLDLIKDKYKFVTKYF